MRQYEYQQSITRTVRGVDVTIYGNGYEYSPDIGIFGVFDEVWADTLDGEPFDLTDEETERYGIELAEAHESWDE